MADFGLRLVNRVNLDILGTVWSRAQVFLDCFMITITGIEIKEIQEGWVSYSG